MSRQSANVVGVERERERERGLLLSDGDQQDADVKQCWKTIVH